MNRISDIEPSTSAHQDSKTSGYLQTLGNLLAQTGDRLRKIWDQHKVRLGGAALAASMLAGTSACSTEAAPGPQTTLAAPTSPSASGETSPSAPNSSNTPETSPSTALGRTETTSATAEPTGSETTPDPDTEALVAALDKASPETFEKLPLDSRLTWALAKYKLANDNGFFAAFLDQKTAVGDTLAYHNPLFDPLNRGSNGQAIVSQYLYGMQLRQAWQTDVSSTGNGPLDQDTAQKLIAGMILDPKSAAYKDHVDTVKTSTEAGRINNKAVFGYQSVSNEIGDDITLDDGSKAPTRNIVLNTEGNDWETVFAFVERPELGAGNGLWLLVSEKKKK